MKLNQWKNTQSVIRWYNNTEYKQKHMFIKFYVKNFYPSSSKNTLLKALAVHGKKI